MAAVLLLAVGTPGLAAPLPLATGAWYAVGLLAPARGGDMAALLPSGKVLIAGGSHTPPGTLNSAELYNPATGTFTPTGAMSFASEQGTATLLPSGKVLIAGGANESTSYATWAADLYDPATGTFTPTGGMADARVEQTATLLPSGKVLLVGGCNGIAFGCTSVWNTADLYDPQTGTFTATGSMADARLYATATLLPSGKVLLAGGASCEPCNSWNTAELYDPATGTFTPTGSMVLARANAAAALLPNGQVLVVGGCFDGSCDPAYKDYASAELYNPATGTWRLLASRMTEPRSEPSATLLPNGQVLVAGGANALHGGGGIEGQPLASADLYNPRTGTFTVTASMHDSRDLHTATLLPHGGVLVAGGCAFWNGECAGEVKNTADVYWYR